MPKSAYIKKKFYSVYQELDRSEYEAEKRRLQSELLKLQQWAVDNNKRIAITFDGRDAAGKGGTGGEGEKSGTNGSSGSTGREGVEGKLSRKLSCYPTSGRNGRNGRAQRMVIK